MDFYFTARHIDVTEALRDHVERHLRQVALDRTGVKVTRMEVQLYRTSRREIRFGCHVLVELPHRHDISIREEDHDLYEAIDLGQKRLARAIIDYRDRQLTEERQPEKSSLAPLARAFGWQSRRTART